MSAKTKSFQSGYLCSEDFLISCEYKTVKIAIASVHEPDTIETADKKKSDKWTIGLHNTDKRLVLCATNKLIIHQITGNPPGDAWIGQEITLQVRIVESFGDMVCAIRVMPPNGCMIKKKVIARLGTKAVWKPPAKETT